ncbi:unnamed protein product [Haemonchus placei]|uniref:Reverse transcriptase domain-containing protein n=1 Tax=Haemonchus placei TaxID=6290 RepID=A0A0N4W7M2_HAEPC|nr:unnamed protein product [Haemonchus placei]
MVQRLAPVLAVHFMGRIDEPVLERNPLMYCRYIDDRFAVTSTQFEMDECFYIMNEQSQHIKLTREVPRDGCFPYLDTRVPSQAAQSNTENAPAQPHNLKRRNYGSTGHLQLLGVRLPTTPQKVAFPQDAALPYRVDRIGVAAGPQRQYLIRTVASQRVTTPPPVRAEADTN